MCEVQNAAVLSLRFAMQLQDFLDKKKPLDSQDHKAKKFGSLQLATSCGRKQGITALGYAIGANRIAVVKLLLDTRLRSLQSLGVG